MVIYPRIGYGNWVSQLTRTGCCLYNGDMQKLSLANKIAVGNLSARSAVPVIGMAALWMSVFKQLLYPALFAYYRTGNEGALVAQNVYSVVLVGIAFALLVAHTRLGRLLGERRGAVIAAVAIIGIAGSAGVALRAFWSSESADGALAVCIGGALSAVYLPVHFAFWGFFCPPAEGRGNSARCVLVPVVRGRLPAVHDREREYGVGVDSLPDRLGGHGDRLPL